MTLLAMAGMGEAFSSIILLWAWLGLLFVLQSFASWSAARDGANSN